MGYAVGMISGDFLTILQATIKHMKYRYLFILTTNSHLQNLKNKASKSIYCGNDF